MSKCKFITKEYYDAGESCPYTCSLCRLQNECYQHKMLVEGGNYSSKTTPKSFNITPKYAIGDHVYYICEKIYAYPMAVGRHNISNEEETHSAICVCPLMVEKIGITLLKDLHCQMIQDIKYDLTSTTMGVRNVPEHAIYSEWEECYEAVLKLRDERLPY